MLCKTCKQRRIMLCSDQCFVCTPLARKAEIQQRLNSMTEKERERLRKEHRKLLSD